MLQVDTDVLEKEATPKLEAEKEAGLGLEVEKEKWDARQNLEDARSNLEAESNPQVCKSLPMPKGCEEAEADKNTLKGRLQKKV